ncbi:response regulator transcription factor [Rhodococcoides trifolii]|nr:response regulator transcription factor [Rhodococcus trifolii]
MDAPLIILLYSDNADARRQVMRAVGVRPHLALPRLEYVEVASEPIVVAHLDAAGIDLVILDGEAAPAGGIGIAKQLKDEIEGCPPIVVITGRADDAWLAAWSGAEAAVPRPIDPFVLTDTVVSLLRSRIANTELPA